MAIACPVKSSQAWKDLEATYGKQMAWNLYYKNAGSIPSLDEAKLIRINHESELNSFMFEDIKLSTTEKDDLFKTLKYWFIRNMMGSFDTLDKLENVLEDQIDSRTLRTIYENTLSDIFNNIPAESGSRVEEILIALAKDHPYDNNSNIFLDEFDIDTGYGQGLVYNQFKKELSNLLSFEVDEESENEKTKGDEDVKDSYGKEALKQNRKDSFSRGIKLLISGIPKLQNTDLLNDASYITTQTFGSAQPMDQSTANNLLLNLFANTPANINDFLDKIYKEKDNNPTINWLYEKIFHHVKVTTNKEDIIINSEIKADETNLARLNLINKFIQSFANYKYKLNSFVVNSSEEGTIIKKQDGDTNNLKNRMLKEWDANLIKNYSEGFVDSKGYKINFNSHQGFLNYILNSKDILLIDRLKALGIPNIENRMLDSEEVLPIRNTKSTLFNVSGELLTSIKKNENKILNLSNIQEIFNPKAKDEFLSMHVSVVGILEHLIPYRKDYDNQLYNIEGNLISSINLNNYQTLMLTRLQSTVDKALKMYPDDFAKNDGKNVLEYLNTEIPEALNLWSSDSIFLNKIIRGNKLSIELLDGMVSPGETGVHTSVLSETDLWSEFINSTLDNLFPAIKHADRSMFYGYSFGYGDTDILSSSGKYVPDIEWKNVFKNHLFKYLDTEIRRIKVAQDKNSIGNQIQNYNKQSKKFILFEDILDVNNLSNKNKIDDLINSYTGFDNLVTNSWVADRFEKWSNQYFNKTIAAAKSVGIGENIKNSGIDAKILNKLYVALDYSARSKPKNEQFLDEVISIAAAKYFIGAIEQSKLFFGDPALYNIKESDSILIYDMIKRVNMQSSTKMVGIVDDINNSFLNNLALDKKYQISFDGQNYFSYKKNFDGTIKELIINDPKTITNIGNELKMIFGEDSSEYQAYTKGFEESDGYSIGNIFFAVEGILRTEGITSGRLNVLEKELKALHSSKEEINKLYTIPKGMSAKDYMTNELRPFTQQKFQYLGPNYMTDRDSYIKSGSEGEWKNRLGFVAGRKTSYGYLMPSMIKGTVLEQLNNFMLENGIDVIHFSSAAKFGASKSRNFYSTATTPEGITYTTRFNNTPIEYGEIGYLDFRYMGKQQEVSYESKEKATDSTQGRKTNLSGIIENGEAINEELAKYLEQYDDVYRNLINELIKELTNSYKLSPVTFNMMDTMKFVNLIRKQAEQRDSPNNIIDSIVDWANSNTTLKYIESLANYQKIQYVLTSIVTNNLLILKRPGTMFPQSPSTGWENKARQIIGDKLVASDEYNFYTFEYDTDGNIIKVNPCECAIPLPVKYIDGLLDYYDGSQVLVNNEIIRKPNAQRSISKLIDILNQEIESGNVQHQITIKGLRIPNQQLSSNDVFKVKKFLNPIYNQTIIVPNEIIVKTGSDYDIDKESLYFPILDDKMMVKGPDELNNIQKFQQELLNLEIKMLLHPSRIKRLLTPVTEGSIKQIAKDKQKQIAQQEKNSFNKTVNKPATHLFEMPSLIDGTLEYVGGKKGVGIVATWITFHKLVERYKVTLKPNYYDINKEIYISTALNNQFLDGVDKYNEDGNIIFYNTYNEHNGIVEQIEDILSTLITSQVDIVKDSYSSVVNIKLNTLNLVCYLVMRGCSTKSIIDFIDNPYVKQFNKIKDINKAQSIDSDYPRSNKDIVEYIANKNKNIEDLLKEYIKLSEQSFKIKDVKDYLSADTKYLKSPEEVWEVDNTLYAEITSDTGLISKKQIDNLRDNSLLSGFITSRSLINTIFDPLYLTRNPNNAELVHKQSLLTGKGFAHIFNTEAKNKAIKRYNEHFITFIIQNIIKYNYNNLKNGPNSLAKRILRAKDNPQLKNNTLIQQLVAIIDNKLGNNTNQQIDNIKLYFSKLTTTETNNLISNYDDIEKIDNDLYKDLVYFNLYQAGISNSPYQLNKILSYRGQKLVLNAINSPEVQKLLTDENLAIFYDKFFKNNPSLTKKNKKIKALDPNEIGDYENLLFEKSTDYVLNPFLLYTKQYTKENKIVLQDEFGNTIIPEGGINGVDYTIKSTDKANEKIVNLISNYQVSEIAEAPNTETVAKQANAELINQPTQLSSQGTVSTDKFAKKNIFSVIPQQGAVDLKATIKASIATQYIGFGEGIRGSQGQRSSTEIYREQAGKFANTGNYSSNDVIFVSVPGKRGAESKRKEQQNKTIKEAIKAVEAGATILTDNKSYIDSSDYNEGEKKLYNNMEAKRYNYSEITIDGKTIGIWSKPSTQPSTQSTSVVKPTINTSKEWKGDLESRPVYTAEGINTMRTSTAKANEHFGNPFSEAGYAGTIKMPSIGAAVIAYKEWLLGTNYTNVKPEQRAWILDQIKQGKLDGATLLYAGKSERRGEGMHPTALAEVVEQLRSTQPSTQVTKTRKTYSGKVTSLQPNQIFVFGSNPEGRHGAGAAKYAKDNFGAIYGQGEGLQGQSYALPTKDLRIKTNNSLRSISAEDITNNIKKLYEVAKENPTKEFLVSDYSESNLNGYTGQEMADMFTAAGPIPSNIVFNENFDKLIQPSTQVSQTADTFYNLKDFSDEQKFTILDNIISKGDATTEEDAVDQLNQMLADDKQFAIEYMKSCLT
jgi:hypothetical protein